LFLIFCSPRNLPLRSRRRSLGKRMCFKKASPPRRGEVSRCDGRFEMGNDKTTDSLTQKTIFARANTPARGSLASFWSEAIESHHHTKGAAFCFYLCNLSLRHSEEQCAEAISSPPPILAPANTPAVAHRRSNLNAKDYTRTG